MSRSVDNHETLPPDDREADFFVVPKTGKLTVLFLGNVDGTLAHWHRASGRSRGFSEPCRGDEDCPRNVHQLETSWKGYAPVEVKAADKESGRSMWFPGALEVTERLMLCLQGKEILRGTVWEMWRRLGRRDRMEVYGEQTDDVDPRSLRVDVDYRRIIERVTRTRGIKWGIKQYLEAPQFLKPRPVLDEPMPLSEPEAVAAEAPPPTDAKGRFVYYEGDNLDPKMREKARVEGRLLPGKRPEPKGGQS